jgi:hypothetical protein
MERPLRALALVAALAAGCGGADAEPPRPAAERSTTAAVPPAPRMELREECRAASSRELRLCERERVRIDPCGPGELPDYDPCGESVEWNRPTIELREGDAWRLVARHPPRDAVDGMVVGHWDDAWLSPDGQTILGQWSSECEVRFAFLLPATGGRLRVVTGERDWRRSPESIARGWTPDGWARVVLPKGFCSMDPNRPPGLYHIHPKSLEARFIRPVSRG